METSFVCGDYVRAFTYFSHVKVAPVNAALGRYVSFWEGGESNWVEDARLENDGIASHSIQLDSAA